MDILIFFFGCKVGKGCLLNNKSLFSDWIGFWFYEERIFYFFLFVVFVVVLVLIVGVFFLIIGGVGVILEILVN